MKKGLSAVLATIVLVTIVVVAAAATMVLYEKIFLSTSDVLQADVRSLRYVSGGGVIVVTLSNTGSQKIDGVRLQFETDAGTIDVFSGSYNKFYLIYVDGIGGLWVDAQQFYQGASEILTQAGVQFTRVSTLSDLDNLVRNPPDGAVVINCHGERVPMPTTWSRWQDYFLALAENVKRRGWIFVTARGYPFFYTQNVTCGASGLDTFLSSVGASANAWGSTSHNISGIGSDALARFGITPTSPLSGVRTVAWYGVGSSYTFYETCMVNPPRDLAAAVRMWGGYYLDCELSQLSSADAGKYAAAFALKLADLIKLDVGENLVMTLSGAQISLGKTYTVKIVLYSLDGKSSSIVVKTESVP